MLSANKKQRRRETPSPPCAEEAASTDDPILQEGGAQLAEKAHIAALEAKVAKLECELKAMREKERSDDAPVSNTAASPESLLAAVGENLSLPPEIWAQVLEFCIYDDVARVARVSRSFLHEVMPLVRTLYVVKQESLTRKQAKRFETGRVEEIVIDVFYGLQQYLHREHFEYYIGLKVAEWARRGKLVLFLSHMPTVKNVFLGKYNRESKREILERIGMEGCKTSGYRRRVPLQDAGLIVPNDGDEPLSYLNLVFSLCAAYEAEFIPQHLRFYGLPAVHDDDCLSGNRCHACKAICDSFPLDQVVMWGTAGPCYFPNRLGNSHHETLGWIINRPGGMECLMSRQNDIFNDLLHECDTRRDSHGEMVVMYEDHVLKALRLLKEHGFGFETMDTQSVAYEGFSKALQCMGEAPPPAPFDILESAFRELVEIGVSLNEQDLRIVPDGDVDLSDQWYVDAEPAVFL